MDSLSAEFEDIDINYADYQHLYIQQIDKLRELLIDGPKRDVVFFGEGNFTFSVAFAALRSSSWEGIISTRYEPISVDNPEPSCLEVQLLANEACITNGRQFQDSSDKTLGIVETVLHLPAPPSGTWRFGIDATKIPDDLVVEEKVVWFQCPWISVKDEFDGTYSLVAKFLSHMADKQADYILIGITKKFPFVKSYMLDAVIPKPPDAYVFLGGDKSLISEVLRYGYKHEGEKDIHDKIFYDHVTLVFKRRRSRS